MGLRRGEQYVEGLRNRQHVVIYVMGERVNDITTNLFLKPSVQAFTFDAVFEEDTRELARAYSPIVGEEINRFNSLHNDPHLVTKVKLLRKLSHKTGFQRCVGWDGLNTIITRKMADRGIKTYRNNFMLEYVQRYDSAIAGVMTDAKGVRALRPSEQPNPDVYVRVIEERDNGIVVRGAKANITGIAVSFSNAH